jgi:hypothetical protein
LQNQSSSDFLPSSPLFVGHLQLIARTSIQILIIMVSRFLDYFSTFIKFHCFVSIIHKSERQL